MAVPVRLGLRHHPSRQRCPVLSELTLTRAAACIRNKHRELLCCFFGGGDQMILRRSWSQPRSRMMPGEGLSCLPCSSQPGGPCPFQAAPTPCIILAGMVKCHMHCPCATALAREGCHRGDTETWPNLGISSIDNLNLQQGKYYFERSWTVIKLGSMSGKWGLFYLLFQILLKRSRDSRSLFVLLSSLITML